jgi:hypothetical protein
MEPRDDNGYSSRKLHLTYVILLLICAGYAATGRWPALSTTFPEFLTALLAASSIYSGANVIAKHLMKGVGSQDEKETDEGAKNG